MAVIYLLWAAGLMLLGRQLRTIFGMGKTCDALACYILIGAVISALIALAQQMHPQGFLSGLVAAKITPQASAHLGQPNHLTDYLALGLGSLGYLLLRFNLKAGLTGPLALLLMLAMTLTGSRSAWLYLLILAMLGLWSLRRLQAEGAKANTAKVFFIGLIPAFALLQAVVHMSWLASSAPMITAMDRMEHAGGNFSDRLNVWHAAWIMFKDAPWFGLGWGEFDWGYFERASLLGVSAIGQRVNHAHNLVLQLLAETGVVGLLLIITGVAAWLLRVLRAGRRRDHYSPYFLLFAVLGVIGIHAMLEYPLWYAYFLGIAALLMGLADPQDFPAGSSLRRAIVLIAGVGLLLATSLAWDYSKIEHWLVSARRFQVVDADLPRFRKDMLSVRRNPLLAPYVDVTLALSAEPSLDHLQDKLALTISAMHFEPVVDLVFAQAILLSLAGQQQEAYRQLDLALAAYPASAGKWVKELSILSVRDPGTYRPLLQYVQSRLERK
jgi:O-antigen ligase